MEQHTRSQANQTYIRMHACTALSAVPQPPLILAAHLWSIFIVLGVMVTILPNAPSSVSEAHTLKAQQSCCCLLFPSSIPAPLLSLTRLKAPSHRQRGNIFTAPQGKYKVRERLRASWSNTSPAAAAAAVAMTHKTQVHSTT